uniref:Putative DNA binding, helix-turn-helix domain containing protein n=1 Tax=viral metagenome TaxID=1070528 RepID=A0A6M3K941_9ZZZZ
MTTDGLPTGRVTKCPRCGGTGTVEYSTRSVFGLNVQRLRKSKGWTQEELARAAQVTRPQLANIESGRSGTTLDGLTRFAEALGVSADQLLKVPDDE